MIALQALRRPTGSWSSAARPCFFRDPKKSRLRARYGAQQTILATGCSVTLTAVSSWQAHQTLNAESEDLRQRLAEAEFVGFPDPKAMEKNGHGPLKGAHGLLFYIPFGVWVKMTQDKLWDH